MKTTELERILRGFSESGSRIYVNLELLRIRDAIIKGEDVSKAIKDALWFIDDSLCKGASTMVLSRNSIEGPGNKVSLVGYALGDIEYLMRDLEQVDATECTTITYYPTVHDELVDIFLKFGIVESGGRIYVKDLELLDKKPIGKFTANEAIEMLIELGVVFPNRFDLRIMGVNVDEMTEVLPEIEDGKPSPNDVDSRIKAISKEYIAKNRLNKESKCSLFSDLYCQVCAEIGSFDLSKLEESVYRKIADYHYLFQRLSLEDFLYIYKGNVPIIDFFVGAVRSEISKFDFIEAEKYAELLKELHETEQGITKLIAETIASIVIEKCLKSGICNIINENYFEKPTLKEFVDNLKNDDSSMDPEIISGFMSYIPDPKVTFRSTISGTNPESNFNSLFDCLETREDYVRLLEKAKTNNYISGSPSVAIDIANRVFLKSDFGDRVREIVNRDYFTKPTLEEFIFFLQDDLLSVDLVTGFIDIRGIDPEEYFARIITSTNPEKNYEQMVANLKKCIAEKFDMSFERLLVLFAIKIGHEPSVGEFIAYLHKRDIKVDPMIRIDEMIDSVLYKIPA